MKSLAQLCPPTSLGRSLLLAGLALASCACSSGREAMMKELSAVKRELTQLRAANLVVQDRMDALEERGTPVAESAPAGDAADGRPQLEVVRLMPESIDQDDAPAVAPSPPDEGPRPVIVGDARGVQQTEDAKEAAQRKPASSRQR